MLGVRPWEQRELLTADELLAAFDYIDDLNDRAKEAQAQARKG